MFDELFHFRSGFKESRFEHCGTEAAALAVRRAVAERPATSVELFNWNYSVEEAAAYIARWCAAHARIVAAGYSWGGDAVVDLAWALKARGRTVDDLIICDGVFRSGVLPTWLPANAYSLLPWGKLKIPPNVRRVHRFYQRNDIPQGHNLAVVDPEQTKVVLDQELPDRVHGDIDESPEFLNCCLRVAGVAR